MTDEEEHSKKTWLEENYGGEYWVTDDVDANELRVDAIEDVCKKILDEVRTNEGIEQMTKFYIGEIVKNLGVEI